jgi:uncharacterized protein YbjQ (UPF0145 family)
LQSGGYQFIVFASSQFRFEGVEMKDRLDHLEEAKESVTATAPYPVAQRYTLPHHMVTTAFTIDGYRIVRSLGVVRGITVRSRSIFGTIGGSLQTIIGGNITAFTRLCEMTRAEAFEIMVQHASEIGANAVIGMRYDATELMSGVSEVLAYGTAVIMEPIDDQEA